MSYEHDPLIYAYISNNFNPVQQSLVDRAFSIFHIVEYEDFEDNYIDIITKEQMEDSLGIFDAFWKQLMDDVNYILKEHAIEVDDTYPISKIVSIMDGIVMLTYLEDYEYISSVLASTEKDTLGKLATILATVTDISEHDVYEIVTEVDDGLLDKLRDYILEREQIDATVSDNDDNISKEEILMLQKMSKIKEGYIPYGIGLILNGIPPKQSIEYYLVAYSIKGKSLDEIAYDIYSIMLVHEPLMDDPIDTYRTGLVDIVPDMSSKMKIEAKLIEISSKLANIEVEVDGQD